MPVRLQCEYRDNPLGVDNPAPRFNWQLSANRNNVLQFAYRIIVSDDSSLISRNIGNIWDSKKVISDQSIQVAYAGKKLESAGKYFWKVMVWDEKKRASAWSKPASWRMGLIHAGDWLGAKWIGYEELPPSKRIAPALHMETTTGIRNNILPLLRKTFVVEKPVKSAAMFISGLGHFEMSFNGEKTGDHFLDPGWTYYDKHAQYVTFDLTDAIKPGKNSIGVMLGNGFFHIPQERYRKITGTFGYPMMICRLLITYNDGSQESVVSDASWKTAPGPCTFSSIFGGEDYDARREQPGWNSPDFDDAAWQGAMVVKGPSNLEAQSAEPLKVRDVFSPVKITQTKPGIWIYDFGQNASAIPQIRIKGKTGDTVRITPGELLDSTGIVSQVSSGGPSYFVYTLNGRGEEIWQPQFTYYGFRYLQIEGAVPGDQTAQQNGTRLLDVKSLHIRNAAKQVGTFNCSNKLFNRIDQLIAWAIRSNIASVFTDCPHREKLGWLEEAHLMGSSIRYNYDIAALLRKVIRDMKYAQLDNGLVPDIAPEYVEFDDAYRDSPEWGSSAVLLPWYLYKWYGDKNTLEESYSMMKRYVDYLGSKSQDGVILYGLGDWFDIGPAEVGESQQTPKGITATAIYYYDLDILVQAARLLGKSADAEKYSVLKVETAKAFNKAFFDTSTGQYGTGSQTANAMPVYMNIVDSGFKARVMTNLINDIRKNNNSLTSGEVGFKYLLRVLEQEGRSDIIFDMNSKKDVPGYAYQIGKGATALTESWQAFPHMSHNHLMLGHLMEWLYSGIGGIRAAEDAVAFKNIIISPEPVGDISSASVSYECVYGLIRSEWKKENGSFELFVEIPPNTQAQIHLPSEPGSSVFMNGKKWSSSGSNGKTIIHTGSGKYRFQVKTSPITPSSHG